MTYENKIYDPKTAPKPPYKWHAYEKAHEGIEETMVTKTDSSGKIASIHPFDKYAKDITRKLTEPTKQQPKDTK